MRQRSEESMKLYHMMVKRGYPEDFCTQITLNLNTDWTARRMMGYLSHYKKLPLEEVVDEMLSIISDRNQIMKKKDLEEVNSRWNEFLNEGF